MRGLSGLPARMIPKHGTRRCVQYTGARQAPQGARADPRQLNQSRDCSYSHSFAAAWSGAVLPGFTTPFHNLRADDQHFVPARVASEDLPAPAL